MADWLKTIFILLAVLCLPAIGWGRGCLVAGTLIDTPGGQIAVEKLQPGDNVWAVEDGKRVPAKVQARYETTTETVVTIDAGGHELQVTPEHPIAIGPGVFRAAGFLKIGDAIEIWDGLGISTVNVEKVQAKREAVPAFNLLVLPGEDFIAGGIVVHNKGCFLPETPIEMADGTTRRIDALHPGDHLPAFTPDGKIVQTTVEGIITAQVDTYLNVWTEDRELKVTPEHPFYIGNGTFQTIGTLHIGDAVYILRDGELVKEHLQRIETVHENVTVYNLQTADPNTFFASGVAVHNKGCFPAGTKILTPTGETPIETLAAGQSVIGVDERGNAVQARILAVYRAKDVVWTLSTDAGILRSTAEHPLALFNGGFREADEIAAGTMLARWDGNRPAPARLTRVRQDNAESTVYTLTVDAPHTFIADGFIVHNKGGGGGGFGGGGGGHFGGGHYYGGGYSTGSQAVDNWIPLIFVLVIVGVFVVKIIATGISVAGASSRGSAFGNSSSDGDELDFVYPRNRIDHKSLRTNLLAEYLSKNSNPPDPMLMPEKITEVAKSTFTLLQQCWEARAYEPMRPLLTPDLFAQHQEILQGMISQHEINRIENLRVLAADLVQVESSGSPAQYHVTVLITASARDYYVDDRTNAFRRGDRTPATFQEFWIFGRSGDQWLLADIEQSKESDILSHENMVEGWTQDQLQAVYAGESDGSTPPGAGASGAQAAAVAGEPADTPASRMRAALTVLADSNPEWEPHRLLTRARTCYIALIAARQAQQPNLINHPCMGPELDQQLQQQCTGRQQDGAEVEYRNFCVPKTELVSIHPDDDGGGPQCVVRMIGHAQIVRSRGGKIESQDPYEKTFTELLTMGLAPGGWRLLEVHPA